MTAAAITAGEARLDIGWVVSATWRVLSTRAFDLLLIALPFLWLPSLIAGLAPGNRALEIMTDLPGLVFTGAASLITYETLTGALPVSAGEAIRAGAARFGTLFLVALATGLMLVIGLILLIVPGIIAGVGFCAASAVVMAENKNAVPALERAWALSRGQRWRLVALLGLLLVASLALVLLGAVVGAVLGLAHLAGAIDTVANLGLGPIAESLGAAVTTIGSAAAYVGLRRAKEGPGEEIARTFD